MTPPKHPGWHVESALQAMGMTQAELARRTELSPKHVNQICRGHCGISAQVALLLEEALNLLKAEDWMRLQVNYDVAVAREARQDEIEARRARRQAWMDTVAPTWLNGGGPDEAP